MFRGRKIDPPKDGFTVANNRIWPLEWLPFARRFFEILFRTFSNKRRPRERRFRFFYVVHELIMKKLCISHSGIFNARVLTALVLCAVGAALGTFSIASNPSLTKTPTTTSGASGTVTTTAAAGTPRFFIYMSPPGVADDSGEPSIGSNWTRETVCHNTNVDGSANNIPNGGTSLYFGGFSPAMAKITWDDCSSPAGATWENKPLLSASTPRAFGDPILFTDHLTGRTFVVQLEGLTPAGSTIDITDDDGDSFIPSDGVIPSDVDHETIGAGPYHTSVVPIPHPTYDNAVYYGSQSVTDARTLRSDTGGLLFSQATTPMYTILDCAGLHGHVKVAPDGTVYIPNVGCGGSVPFHETGAQQAVIVSEDNGITWDVRTIPDSTTHGNGSADNAILGTRDPSVGVATDGTIYFGYQGADGHAYIAVSHDKGLNWSPSVDVGTAVVNGGPVLNSAFPAVVAGDPQRAAFTFFGTETGGENWQCGQDNDCSVDGLGLINPRPKFEGVWYLYVATTFDGGQTWTTQNITPGDPIQRGGICQGSTCRNLLDFYDATIDKEGRVLIGYDDGCITPQCINGDPNETAGGLNDFTAKGAIARQSGGLRMFSSIYDPQEPIKPGAPKLSGSYNPAGIATLNWPAPDNGGSPITGYKIYRSSNGGAFSLVATVPVTNYTDNSFTIGDTYYVTAVNSAGEGPYCAQVTPSLVIPPSPCNTPGILAINDFNDDGSDNDGGQNTPLDPRVNVQQLYVAEPDFGKDVNGNTVEKLVFTMQLASSSDTSVPPSSQWYIVWNRQGTDSSDSNDAHFDRMWIGMKSDATGALSFQYGKFGVALDATSPDPFANTPISYGDADSGTYDVASGVVTIAIANSKLRTIDGGAANKYAANSSLVGLNVRNYLARPDAGQRSQNNANDITNDAVYTLAGNASCYVNRLPVAALSASPTQGNAPLTVSFDGSASSDSDGSVASYSFTFGDGSPEVTQTSSAIQHTYNNAADYFATLKVKDNSGANSSNTASVEIKVDAAPTPTPTPTPTATPAPTATPKPHGKPPKPTPTPSGTPGPTATPKPKPTHPPHP
jgi:PKD repeat protein